MKTDNNQENANQGENRERDQRRGRAGRNSRFSDADAAGGNGNDSNVRDRSQTRRNCRVYISNIPYDYRWQDLKDLFRRIVGSVEYVELFHDESGKARGCGIVEFKDPDNVEKAMEKMNRYEINGRELVVKEDHGEQRDQFGRIVRDGGGANLNSSRGGGGGGGNMGVDLYSRRDDDNRSGRNNFNMMSNDFNNSSNYNLYGLSASFLESLGINGPLHNKVFVANLDYKVDSKKLKQVFKLAGKVQSVDLSIDKEGNSRGFAVIEYDHPVEAVQAISMLDRQMLFDRRMTVRLDRIPDKGEGLKLPEGLGGVGVGLGPNGEPLKDVARNLPSIVNQPTAQNIQPQMQQQQMQSQPANMLSNFVASMGGGGNGVGGNVGGAMFGGGNIQPTPVVAPNAPVKPPGNILGNAASNLNLGNLSSSNLAALSNVLSNPLLTSSLNSLGLNLGQSSTAINEDSMSSANAALSNNYSTGANNYSSGYGSAPGGGGGNVGGSSGGGYNYNAGGGNVGSGGGGNPGMDGNDFKFGDMDMYTGGGGVGNSGSNPGNAGGGRKSDTILIKNIPLSCTWQTLRDKFRDVGEVKFAEIRGNDLGVVRFFKERDAELAIALMDGSRMDGRTIKILKCDM